MTVPVRQPDRVEGWDALRGVAIAFVVMVHAAGPLGPDFYRDHVVGGLARLGVPLFVLLSGLLAGFRATPRERFAAYFVKFVRLHLVYGVLYVAFDAAWRERIDLGLVPLLVRFSGTGWPGQYYFLILVQLYFIAAFLLTACVWSRSWTLAICACLVPVALFVCFGVREGELLASLPDPLRLLLADQRLIWFWLYYFALGAWIGDRLRQGRLPVPPLGATLLLLSLAVVISMFGIPLPGDDADPRHYAYQRPRIYLATSLIALALPGLARLPCGRWLPALGRDSFGVFVVNPALLTVLFATLGTPEGPGLSLALAAATLVIALPLARQLRRRLPWLYA